MILEDWVDADPHRAPRAAHLWLGEEWTGDDPQLTYAVAWAPGTGELYAINELEDVEVIGVLSRGALDIAISGWQTRQSEPGSLHWLCATAAPFIMRRREVTPEIGAWETDPGLDTVLRHTPSLPFEQWVRVIPDRDVPHRDLGRDWRGEAHEPSRRLAWVPTTGELYTAESLDDGRDGPVDVLGVVPDEDALAALLDGWRDHAGEPGGLYWLRTAIRTTARDPAAPQGHDHDLADDLAAPRDAWALPASPVTRVIRQVQAETDDSLVTIAAGLNLDPDWVTQVATGEISEVDLAHIEQVCEGLHCWPHDVWGDDADRIVHAYGPERWPDISEPLEAPYVWDGPDLAELESLEPDLGPILDL